LASLWSYGQFTFVLRLAAYIANQGPRILIGYFFGAAVLGHFGVALRIVETIHQLVAVPAMNVLLPLAARYRFDPIRLHRGIVESTQLCAMVAVPAFVGLAVIAPAAMPLVFGPQWGEGAGLVQLLAAYGLVGASAFLYRGIIAGLGRPDINLVTTLIVAVLGIALMAFVAPWGPMATAAVFVARGYLVYPWLPWVVRRLCGLSPAAQFRVYGPVLGAAAIMGLIMAAFQASAVRALGPAVLTAFEVALGAAVYVSTLYVVGRPAFRLGIAMLAVVRARHGTA
jgi:O-antigen/teichoic acid export membrane protein